MDQQSTIGNIIKSLADLNCSINTIDIPTLFRKYEELGFIYPEKKALLNPYWETIEKNWKSASKADLLRIITSEDLKSDAWATFSSWRTNFTGYINQHLVFSDHPEYIKAVLLGAHAKDFIEKDDFGSFQHFFVESHVWSEKIFGSISLDMDEAAFDLRNINFLRINPKLIKEETFSFEVKTCSFKEQDEIFHFAAKNHSEVFAKAEELDQNDLTLSKLTHQYEKAGLKLHRIIKSAHFQDSSDPIAIIISYQGPLGLSFNFLENRSILIVDSSLSTQEKYASACALLKEITPFYTDFAPRHIPLLVDDDCAKTLVLHGHPLDRKFKRLICLKQGFIQWYQHINKIFRDC